MEKEINIKKSPEFDAQWKSHTQKKKKLIGDLKTLKKWLLID